MRWVATCVVRLCPLLSLQRNCHESGRSNVQGGLPTPAAVYLLQRRDGLRFKIGWALEPVLRVQRLPEFSADELDLVGSHAVWLPTVTEPSSSNARCIADWLPTVYCLATPGRAHRWFCRQRTLPAASRLIRQMPIGADAKLPPSIVAFLDEPQACALEQTNIIAPTRS